MSGGEGVPTDLKTSQPEKRILVVDDDEGMRSMLSLLLSGLGYRVTVAENGQQAFELFSRDRYSLVMTDFCMPVMDGFTLAERVKDSSPKTPIIMITGSYIREGAERECVDYILPKPFQLDAVYRMVEKALTTGHEAGVEMHG
jgi:CheY-like chemotaxis protein